MWRFIVLFVMALVVADTTGLLEEADDIACSDEVDGKRCPPSCASCDCAWHSLRTAPAAVIELATSWVSARTLELPAPRTVHGRIAPPPVPRPPIRPS